MVVVESKQNVYLNRVKHTVFIIREDGLFIGSFSVKYWDASNAACLSVYSVFLEV